MSTIAATLSKWMMGRLWVQWRTGIDAAIVPGSGGVVMVGDSITHQGRWDLLFPGMPFRNLGISGECSDHVRARLAPIIRLRPSHVFLLIGTNDLAWGRSVEAIGADVAAILDELGGALPGCRIHLQTLMPRAKKWTGKVKALNAAYAGIAAERKVLLLDLFPLFDDGTGAIRKDVSNDELHLLGAGYAIWREALAPFIADAGSAAQGP